MSIARDLARLRTPVQTSLGGTGKTSLGEAAVGTVSQTGGVPTGAIVEYTSDAISNCIRWADGTQICTITYTFNSGDFNSAGLLFASPLVTPGLFLKPFSGIPVVTLPTLTRPSGSVWPVFNNNRPTNTNWPNFFMLTGNTGQVNLLTMATMTAIGRWY